MSEVEKINVGVIQSLFTITELSFIVKIHNKRKKLLSVLPNGTKSEIPNLSIIKGNKTKIIGYIWFINGEGLYLPMELYMETRKLLDSQLSQQSSFNHIPESESIPINRLSWTRLAEFLDKSTIKIVGYITGADDSKVIGVVDSDGYLYFTNVTVYILVASPQGKHGLEQIRWGYDVNELYDSLYKVNTIELNDDKSTDYIFMSSDEYMNEQIHYILYRHILTILILSIRSDCDVGVRDDIINLLKSGKTTDGLRLTSDDEYKLNNIIYHSHFADIQTKNWDIIRTALDATRFIFDNKLYYTIQTYTNDNIYKTIDNLISPYIQFINGISLNHTGLEIQYDLKYYKKQPLQVDPNWIGSTKEKIYKQLIDDITNPLFKPYFTTSIAIDLKKDPIWKSSIGLMKLNPGERLDIISN
jgi:hypothetical protein